MITLTLEVRPDDIKDLQCPVCQNPLRVAYYPKDDDCVEFVGFCLTHEFSRVFRCYQGQEWFPREYWVTRNPTLHRQFVWTERGVKTWEP
jgi:hypothetical protein